MLELTHFFTSFAAIGSSRTLAIIVEHYCAVSTNKRIASIQDVQSLLRMHLKVIHISVLRKSYDAVDTCKTNRKTSSYYIVAELFVV